MTLDLTTTISRIVTAYDTAEAALRPKLVQAHRVLGLLLQRVIRSEKLAGQVLHARTRTLARAIFTETNDRAADREIVTRVGVDLGKAPQGRVQELGGVIRPTRAKRLAIPVGRALTPAGVGRVSARTFMTNPSALGFTSAWVASLPGCAVILGQVGRGRARHVEPVFVLRSSVTIPPRSYLGATVREQQGVIHATIGAAIGEGLRAVVHR